jgi:hypothetical protein
MKYYLLSHIFIRGQAGNNITIMNILFERIRLQLMDF